MARSLGQPRIHRYQRRVQRLGEGDVGGVIGGQVFSQIPDASGERGVRITNRFNLAKEAQDEPALSPGQLSAVRVTSQYVEHLYVKEVRDMYLFGLPESIPYTASARPEVKKHRHCRRSVNDDQKTLLHFARNVGVPHPADGDLRWLVHFDGLELSYPFEPLLHCRLRGHLLYLREKVIRERHAGLCRPYL